MKTLPIEEYETSFKIILKSSTKSFKKRIKTYVIPWKYENYTNIDTQRAVKHIYAHESKIMSKHKI